MFSRILPFALLVTVACASSKEHARTQPESAESTQSAPSHRPEAPTVAHWVKQSVDGRRLALTAQIDVRMRLTAPMQVTVQLPPGTKLVQGEPSFQIEPSEKPQLVERDYVFEVTGQPAEDLVLVADVQTAGYGIHATDAYRFGRAAPVIRPNANGPEIGTASGTSLGRSVPMDAPAKK